MTFEDALKLMREGKKVWINKGRGKPEHYFYIETDDGSEKQFLMCHNLLTGTLDVLNQLNQDAIMCPTWEEYKKSILDDREKKYLESLLRPYTKRFGKITITKAHFCIVDFYIRIDFFAFKDDDITDNISLPYFSKSEHMYEGMEVDKSYTLEELGLFDEELEKTSDEPCEFFR